MPNELAGIHERDSGRIKACRSCWKLGAKIVGKEKAGAGDLVELESVELDLFACGEDPLPGLVP